MKLNEIIQIKEDIMIGAGQIEAGHFIHDYSDDKVWNFNCSANSTLRSLKGSPKIVDNKFICSTCQNLTSLEGAPMEVHGSVNAVLCNSIISLKGIGKDYLRLIGEELSLPSSIKSNMLGIILIKELKLITFFRSIKKIQDIFNDQLSGDRDIIECREELIQAGYKEYAKL